MSEKEVKQPVAEPVETEATESAQSTPETSIDSRKKPGAGRYIAAFVIVALIILGVLYLLEKEGRSSTNIFSALIESQQANTVVATVNGEEIVQSELQTSIQQFAQVAVAQGIDTTSPEAQAEMRNQALEVLINTQLLKQAAGERGMSVSEEEVEERLEIITEDIGGEEVLSERMATLGIGEEQLYSDIQDELLIQSLLDVIFAESDMTVSEEEIAAVYEDAGGEDAGLPALEEVRDQVEAQITASKEQEIIDQYLTTLKEDAEINIVE